MWWQINLLRICNILLVAYCVLCRHFLNGGNWRNVYLGNAVYWTIVSKISYERLVFERGQHCPNSNFPVQMSTCNVYLQSVFIGKYFSTSSTISGTVMTERFPGHQMKGKAHLEALILVQHLCHTSSNDICCWFDLTSNRMTLSI